MAEVETEVTPPSTDDDGDGYLPSARLSVSYLSVDETHYDAGVQLFGGDCDDVERFAEALLSAALALAHLRGPDAAWAAMQRFTRYGQDSEPR